MLSYLHLTFQVVHRMFACLFVYNMKYLPSLRSVWTNDRAIFLVQGSFVCPMGIKGNLDCVM